MSRKTQIIRAARLKCPRCGKGDLFIDQNPYNLGKLTDMPARCVHCHQKFEPETGFYLGAMWVSYALGVFASLLLIGVLILFLHMDALYAFIAVALFHLFFSPYLFRFSRALWLSFYVNQHRDI